MNWNEYSQEFDRILKNDHPVAPYNDSDYYNYTKLNHARFNRWLKTAELSDETKNIIKKINKPQHWVLITEPWCGDAAHISPIVYLMSQLNSNINLSIQLRDSNSEIDKYLTNGSKSIPILVVRDEQQKDIFVWGPRPKSAKKVVEDVKANNGDLEAMKAALQMFYNNDKAKEIQQEISALIEQHL